MGRSVSYPSGAVTAFTTFEVEDDEGNELDLQFEFEWLCGDLIERAAAAFPSLVPYDAWRGREDRILMRNKFADFGVSVYGGLVAIWIAERADVAYWDDEWRTTRSSRAQHWLRQIAPRFDALFGTLNRLGHMSNGEGVYHRRKTA